MSMMIIPPTTPPAPSEPRARSARSEAPPGPSPFAALLGGDRARTASAEGPTDTQRRPGVADERTGADAHRPADGGGDEAPAGRAPQAHEQAARPEPAAAPAAVAMPAPEPVAPLSVDLTDLLSPLAAAPVGEGLPAANLAVPTLPGGDATAALPATGPFVAAAVLPATAPLLASPLLTSPLLTSPLVTSPLLTSPLLTAPLLPAASLAGEEASALAPPAGVPATPVVLPDAPHPAPTGVASAGAPEPAPTGSAPAGAPATSATPATAGDATGQPPAPDGRSPETPAAAPAPAGAPATPATAGDGTGRPPGRDGRSPETPAATSGATTAAPTTAPAPAPPAGPVATPAAPAAEAVARGAVGIQHVAPAVEAAIAIAARSGVTRARLHVHPAELGAVEIHLRHTATGGLTARVVAESPEAAAALQHGGDDLRRALEGTGITLAGLDIGARGEGRGASQRAFDPDGALQRREDGAPDTPTELDADRVVVERVLTRLPLPGSALLDVLA